MSDEAALPARWDIFCRVVDNYGDAAVCWRLARQLALTFGARMRLWIDDPAPLQRLVPHLRLDQPCDGVEVLHWRADAWREDEVPADVVVAAFACELPPGYRRAMRTRRPVWVNLEYLSAEDWVEGCHGLPSVKPDGLVEHFFFPGFTPRTGGLLREPALLATRRAFEADPRQRQAWLGQAGVDVRAGESLASLFCYPGSPVDALLEAFGRQARAWRIVAPGREAGPVRRGNAVLQGIPFLSQADYDRLLWSCDCNLVRGEDSLVRALWAARPLVWQIYPQAQGAHRPKLRAFLARLAADSGLDAESAAALTGVHDAWNLEGDLLAATSRWLAAWPALREASERWVRRHEAAGSDLASRLVRFVQERL